MDKNSDRKKNEQKHTVVFDITEPLAKIFNRICTYYTKVSNDTVKILKEIKEIKTNMNEHEVELGKTLADIQTEQAASEARAEARHATSQQTIADLQTLIEQLETNKVDLSDEVATAKAILKREQDYLKKAEEPPVDEPPVDEPTEPEF